MVILIINGRLMELPYFLDKNLDALDYKMNNFFKKTLEFYILWEEVSNPFTFL